MLPNRFVILHHLVASGEHWDLMLEQQEALFTWQMPVEPVDRQACPIECLRIKDHRKYYLDYEGPISGGRGIVSRVDHGTYRRLSIEPDVWVIEFQGQRLHGEFSLVRKTPTRQAHWTLIAT